MSIYDGMKRREYRDTVAIFYFDLSNHMDSVSPAASKHFRQCARDALANDAKGLMTSKRHAIDELKKALNVIG